MNEAAGAKVEAQRARRNKGWAALLALTVLCGAADDDGCCSPPSPKPDGIGVQGVKSNELIVTEIFYDPEGSDKRAEWFEIYNATGHPLNLRGMTFKIGSRSKTVGVSKMLPAGAFTAVCIGSGGDAGASSGCGVFWYYGGSLLSNSGTTITIEYKTVPVYSVTYSNGSDGAVGWPKGVEGASIQLCQEKINEGGNALPITAPKGQFWSVSKDKYDGKQYGSPGKANTVCNKSDRTPSCAYASGSLLVSEVMYNPDGSDGDPGHEEWFELYNNSTSPKSLAGVTVEVYSRGSSGSAKTVTFTDKAPTVPAGGFYRVFLYPAPQKPDAGAATKDAGAKKDAAPTDGGSAVVPYVWSAKATLSNSTGSGIRVLCGGSTGTVLHKLEYEAKSPTSWPLDKSGTAIQLDQAKLDLKPKINAAVAALATSWCHADTALGAKEKGTPASKNTKCPPSAGFCRDPKTGAVRAVVRPGAGDLKVTEVFANPSGRNTYKQWLEVKAAKAVDLNELTVVSTLTSGSVRSNDTKSNDCVPVAAGKLAIIGLSKDRTKTSPTYNGNVPVDIVVDTTSDFLYVSAGTVAIKTKATTAMTVDTAPLPKATSGAALCYSAAAGKFVNATATGIFDETGTPGIDKCL